MAYETSNGDNNRRANLHPGQHRRGTKKPAGGRQKNQNHLQPRIYGYKRRENGEEPGEDEKGGSCAEGGDAFYGGDDSRTAGRIPGRVQIEFYVCGYSDRQDKGGGSVRIPPAVWRYIEYELYSYEQTKKDLEELRESIIASTPYSDIHVQSGPGNPTEKKGLKLISSPAIIHLDRTVAAIEKGLKRLTEDHNELFMRKYIKCESWQTICCDMPLSRTAYFSLRKDIVVIVGHELGLIADFLSISS